MSMTMNALQVKSLDSPDELREPVKTHANINHLGNYTVGRMTMEPGWSWSECIKPVVHTDSCQLLHVGYCLAGQLEVEMDDGSKATIHAGDSFTIPPGHDARVVGDVEYVGLEFASAAEYGVPAKE